MTSNRMAQFKPFEMSEAHFQTYREDLAREIVWFAVIDSGVGRSLWIYDLIIHEQFRRRGYARRTPELVEEKAIDLGARR